MTINSNGNENIDINTIKKILETETFGYIRASICLPMEEMINILKQEFENNNMLVKCHLNLDFGKYGNET